MSPRTRPQDEEEKEVESKETNVCPECGGDVVYEETNAERICQDCGLVIEDQEIDRGPEWRAFDASEKRDKSRVGSPTTEMMHDKGLSTNISWQDKDAYGRQLSSEKRQKFSRLRTWNERLKTKDSGERNLQQALGEISRMGSSLGVPDNAQETASMIYQQALRKDLIRGRSIEGVATASLYLATRVTKQPVPLPDIHAASRVDPKEINRTSRYISNQLDLELEPADPRKYLNRFLSELGVEDKAKLRRQAEIVIKVAEDYNIHSGKSPTGLAASAIYAAGLLTNERLTQREVSNATDTTEVTIRNRYQEMLDAYDKEHGL